MTSEQTIENIVIVNPTDTDIREALSQDCALYKTILDEHGNLYLWDGDVLYHQQVMERYGIPQELYDTAERFHKDSTGEQQLSDYIHYWRSNIRDKRFIDGPWID